MQTCSLKIMDYVPMISWNSQQYHCALQYRLYETRGQKELLSNRGLWRLGMGLYDHLGY